MSVTACSTLDLFMTVLLSEINCDSGHHWPWASFRQASLTFFNYARSLNPDWRQYRRAFRDLGRATSVSLWACLLVVLFVPISTALSQPLVQLAFVMVSSTMLHAGSDTVRLAYRPPFSSSWQTCYFWRQELDFSNRAESMEKAAPFRQQERMTA